MFSRWFGFSRFKPTAQRCVTLHANVDASYSKSKLMRMRKPELIEACQELGISEKGTKDTLSNSILGHFAEEAPDADLKVGESVTMHQAAAPVILPKPVPVSAAPQKHTMQDLASRITALDNDISAKTIQLEKLRDGDRSMMVELVAELNQLKESWQGSMSEVSATLEEVLEKQLDYAGMHKLQQEQQELHELVDGLTGLVHVRDEEIKNLTTQLNQVLKIQEEEKEAQKTERLAVLALASTVSTGTSDSASTPSPSFPASRFASVDGFVPRDTSSAAVSALQSAMAMPAVDGFDRSVQDKESRVFGLALPGLVAYGAGKQVYNAYERFRDNFVTGVQQRLAADATVATLLLVLVAASS